MGVFEEMSEEKSEKLVEVTPNPVVKFGVQLGNDEIMAWIVSTVATGVVGLLIKCSAGDMSDASRVAILAIVGPIAEKPGLFFNHFLDAVREYRAADAQDREPLSSYVRRAFREGLPSLITDILLHDPVYALLLWGLLSLSASSSPWVASLLAFLCFFVAVGVAAALKVAFVERWHRWQLRRLKRLGFVQKNYYEARFLVDPDGDEALFPVPTLDRLQKVFNLPIRTRYTYEDVYVTKHTLASANGRKPYLRFRQRTAEDGKPSKQAVQVMYTRSKEVKDGKLELYRCFMTRKEKSGYDFPLDKPMPWTDEGIADRKVARVVKRLSTAPERLEVQFMRHVAMDPEGIFISVDIPPPDDAPEGTYWLEVKSKDDLDALHEASDYVAWKLPVRATTKTKCDALWRRPEEKTADDRPQTADSAGDHH